MRILYYNIRILSNFNLKRKGVSSHCAFTQGNYLYCPNPPGNDKTQSSDNYFSNSVALATPSFCILHSAFCIFQFGAQGRFIPLRIYRGNYLYCPNPPGNDKSQSSYNFFKFCREATEGCKCQHLCGFNNTPPPLRGTSPTGEAKQEIGIYSMI